MAGLHIIISTPENDIQPLDLKFPAGTLPTGRFCMHIDLGTYTRNILAIRGQTPTIFGYIPGNPTPPSLQRPLPQTERATSFDQPSQRMIRRIEHQQNQRRQLQDENLF